MQVTYTAIFTQHTKKRTEHRVLQDTANHSVHYPAGVAPPADSGLISEKSKTNKYSDKSTETIIHYYSVNIPDVGITIDHIQVSNFNQIGLQKAISVAEYQLYLKIRQVEYDIRIYNLRHKQKKEVALPQRHIWKTFSKYYIQIPITIDTENYSEQSTQFRHWINFRIDGEPFGKERPRSGKGFTYTPKKTKDYEKKVRYLALNALQEKYGIASIGSAYCTVSVKVCYGIPLHFSKKKRVACLLGMDIPEKTPDADNVVKVIMDGLNPVKKKGKIVEHGIYLDDKQVIGIHAQKYWKNTGYVEVTLRW